MIDDDDADYNEKIMMLMKILMMVKMHLWVCQAGVTAASLRRLIDSFLFFHSSQSLNAQ